MRDFKSRYHYVLTRDICMGVIESPCVSYNEEGIQSYLPSNTAAFPSIASPTRAVAVPHVSGTAPGHTPGVLPSWCL